jgi:hypothetical protein
MATVPDKAKRRGTLRDLRTAVTARFRSKPTIEGQRYLDLYVLQRDRFRWLRLMDQAQRSVNCIDLALRKLGFNPEAGDESKAGEAAKAGDAVKLSGAGKASGAGQSVGRGARTIDLGMSGRQRRSA